MRSDVATGDVLYPLVYPIILSDASNSNARTSVEDTVFNENVGRVCLWRNRIITVVDKPSSEGDVVREESISAIGVYS